VTQKVLSAEEEEKRGINYYQHCYEHFLTLTGSYKRKKDF